MLNQQEAWLKRSGWLNKFVYAFRIRHGKTNKIRNWQHFRKCRCRNVDNLSHCWNKWKRTNEVDCKRDWRLVAGSKWVWRSINESVGVYVLSMRHSTICGKSLCQRQANWHNLFLTHTHTHGHGLINNSKVESPLTETKCRRYACMSVKTAWQ